MQNLQASFRQSPLPAGVYLVRYQSELGSHTIRVVKQ
ncbi:T9SS type A sorting domain-containing protein [Hymenobacter sp. 15J16-1T3B]|nr:T9SS type A sorting domain-containing protein [Hymenobacter sp. 15J16-1T3B]MCC3158350.1 T9SS type A sorting domain-containing protein [Hymenobacter sp. 15J16-1T3B]